MIFAIQVSHPQTLHTAGGRENTIRDAIETIFPMDTEYVLLIWNHLYIPLTYKYDVSVIYDDMMDMLRDLLSVSSGSRTIEWGSNTFRSSWSLSWSDSRLTIRSQWYSVIGSIEPLLNQRNQLVIGV